MAEIPVFEAIRQDPANQTEVRQFVIGEAERVGVSIPDHVVRIATVNWSAPRDLERAWATQADLLSYLFARPLGYDNREQYVEELLPPFYEQPEIFQGWLDTPALVQVPMRAKKELTFAKMADIVGINLYGDVAKATDWSKDPKGFKLPAKPYSTWIYDGSKREDDLNTLGIAPSVVRANLPEYARGGNRLAGITVKLLDPKILIRHGLGFPGEEVGPGGSPGLCLWGVDPGFYHDPADDAFPHFGSVVEGRHIVTK